MEGAGPHLKQEVGAGSPGLHVPLRQALSCSPSWAQCPTAARTSSSAERSTKIKRSVLRGTGPTSSGLQGIYRDGAPPSLSCKTRGCDLDSPSPAPYMHAHTHMTADFRKVCRLATEQGINKGNCSPGLQTTGTKVVAGTSLATPCPLWAVGVVT